MKVVIPFAQVATINPNIDNKKIESSLITYLKCIVVSFASIRKFNPKIELCLVTNYPIPDEFIKLLNILNAEIKLTPFTHEPPPEFGDKFRGCFYIFDAIGEFDESILIVDPDVICIDGLGWIEDECGEKIGVFPIDFEERKAINGISRAVAAEIYGNYLGTLPGNQIARPHLGGEILYIPQTKLSELCTAIEKFWAWNLQAAKIGRGFLTTEEHIFSYIIKESQSINLNSYISRIWTSYSYRKHQGNDLPINSLCLWHLPSEKLRGFEEMFNYYQRNSDEFDKCNDRIFKRKVRKVFHIDFTFKRLAIYIFLQLANLKN